MDIFSSGKRGFPLSNVPDAVFVLFCVVNYDNSIAQHKEKYELCGSASLPVTLLDIIIVLALRETEAVIEIIVVAVIGVRDRAI